MWIRKLYNKLMRLTSETANNPKHIVTSQSTNNDKAFSESKEQYPDALNCTPNTCSSLLNRFNVHINNNDYDIALSDIQEAIRLNPDDMDLRCTIADKLYKTAVNLESSKDIENAIRFYDNALSFDNTLWKAYCNRGVIHCMKGNYNQAISDLTEALTLNPNDDISFLNRGIAYSNIHEGPKASDDLEKYLIIAASTSPRREMAVNFIRKYRREDRLSVMKARESDSMLDRVIKLNNENKYNEAIGLCDRAIEFNVFNIRAWDEKAFALIHSGNFKDAKECCEKAVTLISPDPNRSFDAQIFMNMAYTYIELKEYDKAIETLEMYIDRAPHEYRDNIERANGWIIKINNMKANF